MPSIRLSIKPKEHRNPGNYVKFLLATLWAFLVLYQPPLPISIIYLLTGASFVYLVLFVPKKLNHYVLLALPFVFIFCMLLIVNTLNGNSISSISHVFWLWVCIIPAGLVFSSLVEKSSEYLLNVLITAASLQACIALACLFSPSFQESIYSMMLRNGLYSSQHIAIWGYRIYGYGNSLMYSIPITQGVISAWAMIRGIVDRRLRYVILSIFVLFTAILNAKIAIVVFLSVCVIGMFLERKNISRRIFMIIAVVVVFAFLLNIGLAYLAETNVKLLEWLNILSNEDMVQEFYIGYYTDAVKWELPEGIGVIWGTGEPRPNADVDMGFVNDVWIGGIVYTIFTLSTVLYASHLIRNNSIFDSIWRKIISYSLLVTYVIANIKGTAFSYSSFMAVFVMVALFGYRERYSKNRKASHVRSCNGGNP